MSSNSKVLRRIGKHPSRLCRVLMLCLAPGLVSTTLSPTSSAGSARSTPAPVAGKVSGKSLTVRALDEHTLAPAERSLGPAVEIIASFDRVPSFTARVDRPNQRLIVDVPQATLGTIPPAWLESVGVVSGVMAQDYVTGAGPTTRLLIALAKFTTYAVTPRGNDLVILLNAAPDAPAGPGHAEHLVPADVGREASPASAGAEQPQSTVSPAAASGETRPALASGQSAQNARVVGVEYAHAAGYDVVQLRLEGGVSHQLDKQSPELTRLSFEATTLLPELERSLDVQAFHGPIRMLSTFADAKTGRVFIDVAHEKGATIRVTHEEGQLAFKVFSPQALASSVSGVGLDGGVARQTQTLHVEPEVPMLEVSDGGILETLSTPSSAAGFLPSMLAQTDENFSGRRIDLDLKEADVHNVLRLLADVGNVNIVTADNVSGTVTIRMRNVPWDQALSVILRAKSLGMTRASNIIRVAPLADLEKEREMAIARRKQELQLAPLETRLIPVSYAQASDMQARGSDLLSSRGSIAVDARTNVLIVRDVSGNLDQVEELTRSLDRQTPQVLVEARIVEATSRYLRDVGIQWGGDATFSSSTGNPTGLAFPSSIGLAGGASDQNTPTAGLSPFQTQVQNPNFAVNLPAVVGTGSGGALGLTFGSVDNNFNLGVRLSAAETSGNVRILSSPRILTLDNTEARISQGTLIPFSQVSAQGVQTTFQEAKLQLLVRPHVTADGSISMHVRINRDEPDFAQTSARGDPTILKREAETDLLVMDGHTAVIGGIYTRNSGRNLDQVPLLGDIPLLGLLFQRRRANDSRGELVIFLTPRIVNRAEALGR